ncbi:hypothetical protein B0H19DRAFT_470639 [Mycena capillaripes]|nr:hypothetical protein B0H19DRAFT_470639 [Mycena capillaripes]
MPKGPRNPKNDIIFTGFTARRPQSSGSNIDESGESESDLDLNSNGDYQEPPICLNLLKTMIKTVLETDSNLFTFAEINVLLLIQDLSVQAQHLFVFLVIHTKWHRLEALKSVDIPWGDLSCAIAELCRAINSNPTLEVKLQFKPEPMEVCVKMEEDASTSVCLQKGIKFEVKLEPLPGVISDLKFRPSQPNATAGPSTLFPFPRPEPNPSSLCINDSEMTLRQLLEYMEPSERKEIANQLKLKPGKKKTDLIDAILTASSKQTTLVGFFGKGKAKAGTENTQEDRLRAMIVKKIQKLVRLDKQVLDILLRVNVAYFRSTQLPTEVFPRPLRHLQRKYPEYVRARMQNVWEDRETFIEYVDSLKAVAIIDGVLPSGVAPDAKPSSTEKTSAKRKRAVDDEVELKDKKAAAIRKAQATKMLLNEVSTRWILHYALKKESTALEEESTQREPACPGLERLEPGCALTRAVHKGANALKVLNERNSESDVLDELLKQHHWCRGLRGPWHIRKTSILAEKMKDGAAGKAIPALREGIKDGATRLIYREPLITNLAKLQKRLQVEDPVDIPEPPKVTKFVFKAERVATEKKKPIKWKGEDGDIGSIERLVSQHYELEFERSVAPYLTTIFTLLFWDIIFLPMAGAFETDFQTCPLDLCEDAFVSSRRDAIDIRLSEIKAGKAVDFLEMHDSQHRAAKATAVGVRWDLCLRTDMTEVIECIPVDTLTTICQMFCENYVEACMGVPDLVAWDADKTEYKLVHIRGPGYPSRQSKKAWRDVLARGGADQEICEVVEPGKEKKRRKAKKKKDADSDSDRSDDEPESEEDSGHSQRRGSRNSDEDEEYRPENSKRRKIGRD